jgi:hypothetical protein
MLPTVENEKPKLQEPAIPVIIWVYISYVFPNLSSFRFRNLQLTTNTAVG